MGRVFDDDTTLGSIELFCLSAELQGFTAAAAAAGLTPPAVSRAVARLERRLGVQLFTRSTRQVRLTDAGRAYHEQCRQALQQLADAERVASGGQQVPAGQVRISMPTSFGHHRLLPLLPAFRAKYPEVQVEAHVSNRNVDFVAEGYDLAIRGGRPPDSGLVARKLIDAEVVTVAAPAYLRRHGTPRTPAELSAHECIRFLLPSTGLPVIWRYRDDGRDIDVEPQGGLQCADDVLAAVTLARHGAGILQTYRFVVEDELRRGTFREVLKRYGGRSRPFCLLYPGTRHMPLRVRVFVDFLVQRLAPG